MLIMSNNNKSNFKNQKILLSIITKIKYKKVKYNKMVIIKHFKMRTKVKHYNNNNNKFKNKMAVINK